MDAAADSALPIQPAHELPVIAERHRRREAVPTLNGLL
jgi:hypothetical protein